MKKSKVATLAATLIMTLGMAACGNPQATPTVFTPEEGTIKGCEYRIRSYEVEEYEKEVMSTRGYCLDYVEKPGSPIYVYISAGKRGSKLGAMKVNNIDIDDNGNATITVFDTKAGEGDVRSNYPTVEVRLFPVPDSITVVDTDGNILPKNW